jgi:NitT/TauT family transport system substrate-binding protein
MKPSAQLSRRAALALAGGASAAAALGIGPAAAQEPTEVTIGIVNSSSDVSFFIAEHQGYFKAAGIVPKYVVFDSGAKMTSSLGVGQLDVGGGGPSAGLYNAIARGIDIKIVADKGSQPKGFGFQPMLVRKALVDSGQYKSPRDLKGKKFAESAQGSSAMPDVDRIMKSVGLTYNDVDHVFMPFSQMILSFENGAIDASLTAEPSATMAMRSGTVVRVMTGDQYNPGQELAVLLYGGNFIKNKHDLAQRFMVAYLRGARFYNDALKGNKLAGPNADAVLSILTNSTPIKDASLYRDAIPQFTDPNGHINVPGLISDLQAYKDYKMIEGNVRVEDVVDTSFAEAAVRQLGPYKPQR